MESTSAAAAVKQRRRKVSPNADAATNGSAIRLPPHSLEAEQGILGCIMLDPITNLPLALAALKGDAGHFYDLRHKTIFQCFAAMQRKREPVDIITLQQRIKDKGLLEQIGGIAFLNALEDSVPSAANLSYYLDIVIEKKHLRTLIETCADVVARVYEHSSAGTADDLIESAERDISRLRQRVIAGEDVFNWSDLVEMDTDNDLNCVLGYHEGKTTRYLCKGHSAWLIGPSGIGKSSLLFQMGVCYATGRPFFGIATAFNRPMRVLIVQAENDKGDMAEMTKGLHTGNAMAMEDELLDLVRQNIKVVSTTGKISHAFCVWLRGQIEDFKADIVLVDPLLSFAGIDVSRQDQVSQFCRVWLDPVLRDTGAVMIAAHHTGKPPKEQGNGNGKPQPQSLTDLAYAGIGSSELVNWARAVMILQRVGDNQFRLVLAKRGKRAGAIHPDGTKTTSLYLCHAETSIFWQQLSPHPDDPSAGNGHQSASTPGSGDGGGRPSKATRLLKLGLGMVIDGMVGEPVGKNELARQIESYAASKAMDVQRNTCLSVIEKLVENGAIRKTDSGYLKA